MADVSIVVRAYNEARWLPELLAAIDQQDVPADRREVVLVDSGSTDETVAIAQAHGCRIVHIRKEDFTFGRSLNDGCRAAEGKILVFISAHCIPIGSAWLRRLVEPLENGTAAYCYGRQQAHELTKFSERQIFTKYFPEFGMTPQPIFFCNNANSAILASTWRTYGFDEEISGLEDMELGKRIVRDGLKVQYVPEASVYHIHQESWRKVRIRYEREAIALRHIMPEVHVHFSDFCRYTLSAILLDFSIAAEQNRLIANLYGIVMFRVMQYWGVYRGNNEHRRFSAEMKHRYFYPR